MGGSGSGTWHRCEVKLTTDAVPSIDIGQLQRRRGLVPCSRFVETWTRGGMVIAQVAVEVQQDQLRFRYVRVSGAGEREPVDCVVPIASTPCNYGGSRRWFRCPECKKRIAVIYIQSLSCACRKCSELVYSSQRESAGDRARQRAQNIRMRLGGSANLFEPFPRKPKWMRWTTYQRLQLEAIKDEGPNLAHLISMLNRRQRRVGNLPAVGMPMTEASLRTLQSSHGPRLR